MSKKRSSKSNTTKRFNSPTKRDIVNNTIARRSLLSRNIRTSSQMLLDIARLSGQDNRTLINRKPIIKASRTVRGFIAPSHVEFHRPLMSANMKFSLPKETTVCVRRGVRREVLHALKKTGKGSRSPRRYTSQSNIKC